MKVTLRVFSQLALGVLLSGCTITNNIHSSSSPGIEFTSSLQKDIQDKEDIAGFIKEPDKPIPRQIQRTPQQLPQAAKRAPNSKYCERYEPLAVPAPVEIDETAYNELVSSENDIEIANMLMRNIKALRKQMADYKVNLNKHQEEWRRQCGK